MVPLPVPAKWQSVTAGTSHWPKSSPNRRPPCPPGACPGARWAAARFGTSRASAPTPRHWTARAQLTTLAPVGIALLVGNSDGIGLALTRRMLGEGWQVIGVSRSASPLSADHYEHHRLDVCHERYAPRLAELVGDRTVDLCVYCAGIGEWLDLETMAAERRVFEVNLLGAVATAQAIVPAMVRAGRGHFIGLSSQADVLRDAAAPSYSASKAGLSSYLEGLAWATRSRGVFVTNLRLGFVDTKMAKADVRPFMVGADVAAQRVLCCVERKPVRATFPWTMAALLWLLRRAQALGRWARSIRSGPPGRREPE